MLNKALHFNLVITNLGASNPTDVMLLELCSQSPHKEALSLLTFWPVGEAQLLPYTKKKVTLIFVGYHESQWCPQDSFPELELVLLSTMCVSVN